MARRGWWWIGILILVGALGGCGDDDHDHHDHHRGCLLLRELEPNDTPLTANFLGDAFVGDCADVEGRLFDPADVDTYRFLVQESLSLVVTLDHNSGVDFDVQLLDAETHQPLLDCGSSGVPKVCAVSFAVSSRAIAVDVVVTAVIGAGLYTLTLDAQ